MTILDPHYECVSLGSAAPETIDPHRLVDELLREINMRRTVYPRRVAKHQMDQADADNEIEMMAAIHADIESMIFLDQWDRSRSQDAWIAWRDHQARANARIAPFGWAALVACLRREITSRRRLYPKSIEKGQLSAIDARHQLERLEAVHCLYWVGGRHFWPDQLGRWRPDGPCSEAELEILTPAYRAHRALFLSGRDNHAGLYQPTPAQLAAAAGSMA